MISENYILICQAEEMNDPTLDILDRLTEKEKAIVLSFADRHIVIGQCSEKMHETLQVISDRGLKTHETVWNACLFLNIVSYDLSVLVHDIVYQRDPWKRKLSARNLATLLFEIGEDLPTVFGKKFRKSCQKLNVTENMLSDLNREMKKISSLWKENQNDLKNIRLIAGAHRDHNAVSMFELIEKINLFDLMGIGVKFGSLLNNLGKPSQAIMTFTASSKPPEQSMAEPDASGQRR